MNQITFSFQKWSLLLLLLLSLVACGGNTTSDSSAEPTSSSVTSSSSTTSETDTVITKLNLNEASNDDFLTVPDVGSRMVREFMEYRPYISIEQFRREIGKYVSDEQVAAYEQYVYVPVDVNNSDAETLKQLPGVDDTIAADLMAARPYGTNDDFLAKLATYVSETELTTAESFLVTP